MGGRGHAAPVSKGFTKWSWCSVFGEVVATGLAEFRRAVVCMGPSNHASIRDALMKTSAFLPAASVTCL